MSLSYTVGEACAPVRLKVGQSVILPSSQKEQGSCIEVLEGIARLYWPGEAAGDITVAFLQAGDQIPARHLSGGGMCIEALTPLSFHLEGNNDHRLGMDVVAEWTFQLLRIHHLGSAENRLNGLFVLLVNRLGKRCGDWCTLPFSLSHDRISELIGTTRVTSTRLISKLRHGQMLNVFRGGQSQFAASLIEYEPIAS